MRGGGEQESIRRRHGERQGVSPSVLLRADTEADAQPLAGDESIQQSKNHFQPGHGEERNGGIQ